MTLEEKCALLERIVANQRVEIERLQDAMALEWARNNPQLEELGSEHLEDAE